MKRSIGAAISLLIGFAIAEACLRLAAQLPATPGLLRSLGGHGSALLVQLEAAHLEQRLGEQGTGPVRIDPVLGWTNRPGAHELPYGHVIEGGIRRPKPLEARPAHRVLILGDSFAYSYGAPDDQSLDQWLERTLVDTQVLNLAVPGYSYEQILLRWRAEGAAYQPDVVLFVLVSADVERNGVIATDYLKPWSRIEGGELVFYGIPVPSPAQVEAQTRNKPLLWLGVQALWPDPSREMQEAISTRALQSLVQEVSAQSPLVVLSAPTPSEYHLGPQEPSIASRGQWLWNAACADTHPCIDATPEVLGVLTAHENGEAWGHWSPAVLEALAKSVAPAITQALGASEP